MNKFLNLLGWLGAILIIIAYILISSNIVLASNLAYQILNLLGAIGIMVSSYHKKDIPPVILNIFWGLIALTAIINLLL